MLVFYRQDHRTQAGYLRCTALSVQDYLLFEFSPLRRYKMKRSNYKRTCNLLMTDQESVMDKLKGLYLILLVVLKLFWNIKNVYSNQTRSEPFIKISANTNTVKIKCTEPGKPGPGTYLPSMVFLKSPVWWVLIPDIPEPVWWLSSYKIRFTENTFITKRNHVPIKHSFPSVFYSIT